MERSEEMANEVDVAFVVEADEAWNDEGKMTWLGKESVHVRSAERSCAPAEEVIWFAVPATVSARVVGMSAVNVVPPTETPEEKV